MYYLVVSIFLENKELLLLRCMPKGSPEEAFLGETHRFLYTMFQEHRASLEINPEPSFPTRTIIKEIAANA
jgi:hypothetical protein